MIIKLIKVKDLVTILPVSLTTDILGYNYLKNVSFKKKLGEFWKLLWIF